MQSKIFNNFQMLVQSDSFLLKLEKENLLRPGALVSKDQCEEILGVSYKKDDWNFLGPFLTLKLQIEAKGFFVSQSGLEAPSFRLLNTDEMAAFAFKRMTKAMCSNFKTSYIMAAHDTSTLNETDLKVYKNVKEKAATMALSQQKIILDEVFF